MVRRTPPICRRVHDVVSFKIAVTSSCSVRHSVVQQVPAQKWRRVSGYSVAVARPAPFGQRSESPPQSGFQAIARQLVPAWAHGLASLCGLPMPLTHSRHTRFGGGSRPDRCIAAYSDRATRALLLATALKALIALPTARPPERSIRVRMGRLAPGWPWQRWQQQAAGVVQQARPAHAERTGTSARVAHRPIQDPLYQRPTGSCSQPHCGAC